VCMIILLIILLIKIHKLMHIEPIALKQLDPD